MCPSISQRGIFLPWARTIQRKAQYSHVVEYYAAKEWRSWSPVASWEMVTSSRDQAQCRTASVHVDVVGGDLEQ